MRRIYLPARIDFAGGWTDQECWPERGAVLNAAVGWDGGFGPGGRYPMCLTLLDDGAFHLESVIEGQGTGLGVSQILAAGKAILRGEEDWLEASLAAERDGTRGGWQDAIGGIEPGMKLIVSDPLGTGRRVSHFRFRSHYLMDHLILFDTGSRRDSRDIGSQVRAGIAAGDPRLATFLRAAQQTASKLKDAGNPRDIAEACCALWKRLEGFFPVMKGHPDGWGPLFYAHPLCWGAKLCGAGGGGYGIAFVKRPEWRKSVIDDFRHLGRWATIPHLLNGPHVEEVPNG